MPASFISYDKELPEIVGRVPWEAPTAYLVKDANQLGGWRVESSGRRPSKMLLVNRIRAAVAAWREGGYQGGSDTTRRLFEYWFEEDHQVSGFSAPFRYYYCQREAIETIAYLVEISGMRDAKALV